MLSSFSRMGKFWTLKEVGVHNQKRHGLYKLAYGDLYGSTCHSGGLNTIFKFDYGFQRLLESALSSCYGPLVRSLILVQCLRISNLLSVEVPIQIFDLKIKTALTIEVRRVGL